MFESKAGVLLIGGLGFFLFAFVSNALVPVFMYQGLPEQKVAELVNANLMYEWEDLSKRFPEAFKKHFGEPTKEKAAEALAMGRNIYVGEGCWHRHSQFVRPVSNESKRFGPVAKTEEYQNELQRPVLFGTRRVGPDLSREGGRRSNDWHAVHFFQPETVSARSPMPEYPWFFDGSPDKPNKRGLAIMAYVQWLGSWLESFPYYEDYLPVDGMDLKQIMPPMDTSSPPAPPVSESPSEGTTEGESAEPSKDTNPKAPSDEPETKEPQS